MLKNIVQKVSQLFFSVDGDTARRFQGRTFIQNMFCSLDGAAFTLIRDNRPIFFIFRVRIALCPCHPPWITTKASKVDENDQQRNYKISSKTTSTQVVCHD